MNPMIVKLPHFWSNGFVSLDISKPYKYLSFINDCCSIDGYMSLSDHMSIAGNEYIENDILIQKTFDINLPQKEVEKLIENAKFEMKFKELLK